MRPHFVKYSDPLFYKFRCEHYRFATHRIQASINPRALVGLTKVSATRGEQIQVEAVAKTSRARLHEPQRLFTISNRIFLRLLQLLIQDQTISPGRAICLAISVMASSLHYRSTCSTKSTVICKLSAGRLSKTCPERQPKKKQPSP